MFRVNWRAIGGADARRLHHVLDGKGQTVQGTQRLTLRLAIFMGGVVLVRRQGSGLRLLRHQGHQGVEPRIHCVNASQMRGQQFPRGKLSSAQEGSLFRGGKKIKRVCHGRL